MNKLIPELTSLDYPPESIIEVGKCILILYADKYPGPKKPEIDPNTMSDRRIRSVMGQYEDEVHSSFPWNDAKKLMENPLKFNISLEKFNALDLDEWKVDLLRPIVDSDHFCFGELFEVNKGAAYLCEWIRNITIFGRICLKVSKMRKEYFCEPGKISKETKALAESKERILTL